MQLKFEQKKEQLISFEIIIDEDEIFEFDIYAKHSAFI